MLVEPLLEIGDGAEVEEGFAEVVELGGGKGVEAGEGETDEEVLEAGVAALAGAA